MNRLSPEICLNLVPLVCMALLYGLPVATMIGCQIVENRNVGMAVWVVAPAAELVALGHFARRIWRGNLRNADPPVRLDWSLETGLLFLCAGWLVTFLTLLALSLASGRHGDPFEPLIVPGYLYVGITVLGWTWVVIALCEPRVLEG